MRIETEEHVIPEKRYTTTKYIASDGTEFCTEDGCLKHEEQLEIQNHPVFRSAITEVLGYRDEGRVNLYYISSFDDYNFLIKNLGIAKYTYRTKLESDFRAYGSGWYLYWDEYDDYHEYYYIRNYNAYVEEIESELKEWKNNIEAKMKEVKG